MRDVDVRCGFELATGIADAAGVVADVAGDWPDCGLTSGHVPGGCLVWL